MLHKIGIDLGGTKIEGVLLNSNLDVVHRKRIPTPRTNYQAILKSITSLVTELSCQIEDFTLGICTPGSISKKTGLIKNSNTQSLIGKSVDKDLENLIGCHVSIENDANCFAMAEATLGAAKGFDVVFGVIVGTGVGGGIIIDGKIHQGRTNIAGEWGHHTIHPQGNPCYCGRRGCVETYISGPALEKKWLEMTRENQTIPEILHSGNPKFQLWRDEFLENFSIGLANVIDILDPDIIVLGGGLSNIDFLYSDGKNSVYEKVFSDIIDTPILQNQLGDSAGVFGAALLN